MESFTAPVADVCQFKPPSTPVSHAVAILYLDNSCAKVGVHCWKPSVLSYLTLSV